MRKLYYYVYKLKFAGLANVTDDPYDPNDSRFTFYKPDGHERKNQYPLDRSAYRENDTQK